MACYTFHHLSSPFITFHHLSSPSITCHHLPSPAITLHHLSSPFITFHHLPSPAITFHHLPSPAITFHHLPSPGAPPPSWSGWRGSAGRLRLGRCRCVTTPVPPSPTSPSTPSTPGDEILRFQRQFVERLGREGEGRREGRVRSEEEEELRVRGRWGREAVSLPPNSVLPDALPSSHSSTSPLPYSSQSSTTHLPSKTRLPSSSLPPTNRLPSSSSSTDSGAFSRNSTPEPLLHLQEQAPPLESPPLVISATRSNPNLSPGGEEEVDGKREVQVGRGGGGGGGPRGGGGGGGAGGGRHPPPPSPSP